VLQGVSGAALPRGQDRVDLKLPEPQAGVHPEQGQPGLEEPADRPRHNGREDSRKVCQAQGRPHPQDQLVFGSLPGLETRDGCFIHLPAAKELVRNAEGGGQPVGIPHDQ
jgi:hypothetical protein